MSNNITNDNLDQNNFEIKELSDLLDNSYKQLGIYAHSIEHLKIELARLQQEYSSIMQTINNCLELLKSKNNVHIS